MSRKKLNEWNKLNEEKEDGLSQSESLHAVESMMELCGDGDGS